jgi:CRP/FNR family cyclic AMP-dependent transcriptional regulator
MVLRLQPVKERLPLADLLQNLPETRVHVDVPARTVLPAEQTRQFFYLLLDGQMQVTVADGPHAGRLMELLFDGEFLGFENLGKNLPVPGRRVILQKTSTYLAVPVDVLEQYLTLNGELAAAFAVESSQYFQRYFDRALYLGREDAAGRVTCFLREQVALRGERLGLEAVVRHFGFTHQMISDLTGVSRQSVTTIINDLRRKNVIYLDRKNLIVRDPEAFLQA